MATSLVDGPVAPLDDGTMPTRNKPPRLNQIGQKIGAKGERTRQRLIDVTVELLETHGMRDLTVAEIARVAETSSATFYVYFDNVQAVVLQDGLETPLLGMSFLNRLDSFEARADTLRLKS